MSLAASALVRATMTVGTPITSAASLADGDDRREPVDPVLPLGVVDLIRPLQRMVYGLDQPRPAVGGIQALVRIHLAGQVGVRRNLPARQIDGLEPRLDLLHRLVARHSP